jgi:thiol-disulfide isomerase/thioredoxin
MSKLIITTAAAALAAIGLGCAAFASSGPALTAVLSSNQWLNSQVKPGDVRGKVVLVDFYTFDCINCKHVEPNLRALYHDTSRDDLVIISVHSPETPFERDRGNLIASTKAQGVVWPVVIDNDFQVWNAYGVSAWPTQLIFDRRGDLRQTIVGEGQDDVVDKAVKTLIAEKR